MAHRQRRIVGTLFALALLFTPHPALAGPPFLCHQFEIGDARSLPWDDAGWWSGRHDYNLAQLVTDTQALLTPSTPVIQRMETLRRATLYASLDRKVASRLLTALSDRARTPDHAGQSDAFAWFDLGYLIESFRETDSLGDIPMFRSTRSSSLASLAGPDDPRTLIGKSLALRPGEPSIEFALALIANGSDRREHGQNARSGAHRDALLAHNIHLFLD